jgi:nucleoside-diphosphate-sugar epimerase
MRRILIAGCGFLGKAAACLFREQAWKVLAVTNSEESARQLRDEGWDAVAADISSAADMRTLQRQIGPLTAWLHCASSRGGGPEVYERVYLQGVKNLLIAFPESRALFTSSTSVYGQLDGSTVTEESPADPSRETGRILLQAENEVLGRKGAILRLAGIYGPGRSVLLKKFLSGQARLEAGGKRWINQIHRDDAAAAWFFLAQRDRVSGIFNCSDNQPMQQREIYTGMASRTGRDLPPEAPADFNRKRGWTNKRVSNAKLRALGWEPRYSEYFSAWEELLAAAD